MSEVARKKLRVLHVLGELKPSGAEVMLSSAAPAFREAGVEAEILSTGSVVGEYAEELRRAGYIVHHEVFRRSFSFFFRIARLIKDGRYYAVHLHCEGANFWFGLCALLSCPGVVVQTIHNAFQFDGWLRVRRGWQRRTVRNLGVRHISISQSVFENEISRFNLQTEIIQNWYDPKFVCPNEAVRLEARSVYCIHPGDFVVAVIGNCSLIKNHTAVIEAISTLPMDQRPLLLHAGLEEFGNPESVLAEALGVADRVRFLGAVSNIKELLNAADAFVMPSRYEGFGIAAIEAIASGLPVVLADVPGLRDFKESFPNIVYVNGDPKSIAVGLLELRQRYGSAAAKSVRLYEADQLAKFQMSRGASEYINIYTEKVLPNRIRRLVQMGSKFLTGVNS